MAYRRCLLLRRSNLADLNCQPSFCYVLHSNDDKREHPHQNAFSAGINTSSIQTRSFGFGGSSLHGSMGFSASSQRTRMVSNALLSTCSGYSFCRYMSTVNDGSDKTDFVNGVSDFVTETTLEAVSSAAPVVNEVAIAAADSVLPVKVFQYVIDAVHTYTGLNWWAAIALTTLLIRSATIPFLLNQLKANSKFTLTVPPVFQLEMLQMEEINAQMEKKAKDPAAVAEGQKQLEKLMNESSVGPFTPLKGLFIQGPFFISFFLAIQNMAEKMPSFKHGGAFWFTDLTTPDALYIFPVMTALSYLITVEYNIQEVSDGTLLERSGSMRNLSRVLAVLAIPLTMGFPKAILCFWLSSNLFSIMYGLAIKTPSVKKTLGIPDIAAATPTSAPQSPN